MLYAAISREEEERKMRDRSPIRFCALSLSALSMSTELVEEMEILESIYPEELTSPCASHPSPRASDAACRALGF